MAVYKMNVEGLAQYISDTQLGFKPQYVESTTGTRNNGACSGYKISAQKIVCEKILVKNDCFIDLDGRIAVISYIPPIKFSCITNEFSDHYRDGSHLSFDFSTESMVTRYDITDVVLRSYEDFKLYMDNIIRYIGYGIEAAMNKFKNGEWIFDNVVCKIDWNVEKIKRD